MEFGMMGLGVVELGGVGVEDVDVGVEGVFVEVCIADSAESGVGSVGTGT
jgi:hypothetical protein